MVSSKPDNEHLEHSIQVVKRFSWWTAHYLNNLIAVMQGFASVM
jgi:hypothetical protein